MGQTDNNKWFALQTKPRAEKVAEFALHEKDITVYLPMQKRLKQWSDRKKWVEEPVLRSYIFIRGNERIIEKARFARGIVKPVQFNNIPEPIPDEQMKRLQRVVESGLEFEVDNNEKYSPGDKVEVIAGDLVGIKGEMVASRGKNKLLIRLESVQQAFLINIAHNYLKKLAK